MPKKTSTHEEVNSGKEYQLEKLRSQQRIKTECLDCSRLDELLNTKRQLQKAVLLGEIGYFETNLITGEVHWDAQCYNIHGISDEFSISYETFIKKIVHPDDIQLCLERFRRHVILDEPFMMEYRALDSSGNVQWIKEKVEPQSDSTGSVTYIYGAKRNITKERGYQQKLKEYQRMLEEKNRQLELLVTHDDLTKIYNRRMFNECFEAEWHRALRTGSRLTIAMADIDHFKEFNDLYGHLAGDICLSTIADTLQQTLTRSTDMVARYGGEEFAFVLPDTSEPEMIFEQCRKNVASLHMSHKHNVGGIVTISIGAATMKPTKSFKKSDLLRLADEMLYMAKANGRNQVLHTFKKDL